MKSRSQVQRIYCWLLLFCLTAVGAWACRYSVREVGFADFERAPYQLIAYVTQAMSDEQVEGLEAAMESEMLEANVTVALYTLGESMPEQVNRYIDRHAIDAFPAAVFVSPSGESTLLDLPPLGADFAEQVAIRLRSLVDSPLRKKIRSEMVEALCMAIFIPSGAATDASARAIVLDGVEELNRNKAMLEKSTERGAVFLELPLEKEQEEALLLWSLGLDATKRAGPQVALLFGRGRRMGEVLRADRVAPHELVGLMALAGASCECGLDRKWMQGMMIPLRWDQQDAQRLSKHLGFDPESPLVKMEMSQIIAHGGSEAPETQLDPLMGYREAVIMVTDEGLELVDSAEVAEEEEKEIAPRETAALSSESMDDKAPPISVSVGELRVLEERGGLPLRTFVLIAVALLVANGLFILLLFWFKKWKAS